MCWFVFFLGSRLSSLPVLGLLPFCCRLWRWSARSLLLCSSSAFRVRLPCFLRGRGAGASALLVAPAGVVFRFRPCPRSVLRASCSAFVLPLSLGGRVRCCLCGCFALRRRGCVLSPFFNKCLTDLIFNIKKGVKK